MIITYKYMGAKSSGRNFPIIILAIFTVTTLFITGCTKDEDVEKMRKEELTQLMNSEISADTLRSLVSWMQGMGNRFALSSKHRDVAVQIRNRFKSMGYDNARLDSFTINKTYRSIAYQQVQYNVVATLNAAGLSDSTCIVGGHYDNILSTGDPFTIVPGANDNASGVAAAMEIARVMKKNNFEPRNTIRFMAFGSEELGLYGSSASASEARQTVQRIMFMLNNDMIAYEPDNDASKWAVNILDYDNSHYLRKEAEALGKKYVSLGFFNDNTSNKYSDSYPYFKNGFKALFFYSKKTDPNYHTLNDLTANCNFEYCKEIVKLNCAILIDKN